MISAVSDTVLTVPKVTGISPTYHPMNRCPFFTGAAGSDSVSPLVMYCVSTVSPSAVNTYVAMLVSGSKMLAGATAPPAVGNIQVEKLSAVKPRLAPDLLAATSCTAPPSDT